jgi:uncharacterized membrane protein YkvA (DUF1232 family)
MARSKRGGRGFLGSLNLLPFLPLAGRAPMYGRLLWALASDPRVPVERKALLGVAGAYILSPIDFVPDRLPVIGAIDDVAVLVLAIDLFLEGLPEALINEKLDELGIPRSDLESDLASVRRVVPRPLRSLAAQLPDLLGRFGRFINDTGLDRQTRRVVGRARTVPSEGNPA